MNNRQKAALKDIFKTPTPNNIKWADIESLIGSIKGSTVDNKRAGSRVGFVVNGKRAVFHRPHPRPDTNRNTVRDIRDFLKSAGVTP